ncbi:UvrABC system protein C [Frankliniella fusca]|uniref:UvrABC system protein C n=1 Tax=Frankliniella fusca TaxID=407009 RepID=A0AAE1LDM1_9NEOP|nr:UvrABC system protein C [Frankliniella fusca]
MQAYSSDLSACPLKEIPHFDGSEDVVWVNQTPSSTRYSRLISFSFERETEELSKAQFNKMMKAECRWCNFLLSLMATVFKCLELILHIAYRLPFRRWRVSSKEDKDEMSKRQQSIQERFRKEAGLLVDVVKRGHGTTNDGNTSRRFFRDPVNTSNITGVDLQLIKMLHTIIEVLPQLYESSNQ